jgi:EEF1A lysine methyltransferase 4
MAKYSDSSYWEKKYSTDISPFDWYQRYNDCKPFSEVIKNHVKYSDIVLIAGIGTSLLAENMWEDGYTSIVSIDNSPTLIEKLSKKYEKKPLKFYHMNISCTNFEDGFFNSIIDKALLDSLMCNTDLAIIQKYLNECSRILKKDGVLIIVSHSDNRLDYLQHPKLQVSKISIPKPSLSKNGFVMQDAAEGNESSDPTSHHTVYICRKI